MGKDPQGRPHKSFPSRVQEWIDLACSKRSDRGEQCEVKKAMKSRGGPHYLNAWNRLGSTPTSTFQRMTSCTLAKTAPVGDEFQLTALRSTDDDDDIFVSRELRIGV